MSTSESNATTPRPERRDGAAWRQWHDAAGRATIDAALRALFHRLDVEVASHHPVCRQSGRCCHFDSYGHQMYVTGLEVAWLLRQVDTLPALDVEQRGRLPLLDGCQFQVDGLCSVHALRPLGCRVFFCDPSARAWEGTLYEGYLQDLRALHDLHALPYEYMEWRAALRDAMTALQFGSEGRNV